MKQKRRESRPPFDSSPATVDSTVAKMPIISLVQLAVSFAWTKPVVVGFVVVAAVGRICCFDGAVAAGGDCRNDGVGYSVAEDKNAAAVDNIVADNGWVVGILPSPRLLAAAASCAREQMEPERE